jgi:hypothetical protein
MVTLVAEGGWQETSSKARKPSQKVRRIFWILIDLFVRIEVR